MSTVSDMGREMLGILGQAGIVHLEDRFGDDEVHGFYEVVMKAMQTLQEKRKAEKLKPLTTRDVGAVLLMCGEVLARQQELDKHKRN